MDKAKNCAECKYVKLYNYGNKIYYCDHVDRVDEMGKISVNGFPVMKPAWCPLRDKANGGKGTAA